MTKRFDSVLIANRGEIVTRIARTAKTMGLHTVAVYSDADRQSVHAHSCDARISIGGERSADSYLRMDKILLAAKASGSQAIHPGYGFLAENSQFAQSVQDAGLVWIGPSPQSMYAMGDKARARERMANCKIPVLPGYNGQDQHFERFAQEATDMGYPLMIKASAGGGGRGMRLVEAAEQLKPAFEAARSEALAAFGDGHLLLERALVGPRHVEVQILADQHGHVLYLGERDCSVQRRHQKIIEEAPSPAVNAALRRQMGACAVNVAREVGYVGAGTVEFLLDAQNNFWFMEMNTRLQVEHPITEALIGLDLVQWQLRIAQGEALTMQQEELLARFEAGGHAIEARLCAEDPAHGYLPQSGQILRWRATPNLRTDHAMADGQLVPSFYDSLLAKLVAHAPTREAACQQLAQGLANTVCMGLPTNRHFLTRIARHPAFVAGAGVTTAYLAQYFPDDAARCPPVESRHLALVAASLALLPAEPLPKLWQQADLPVHQCQPLEFEDEKQNWNLN